MKLLSFKIDGLAAFGAFNGEKIAQITATPDLKSFLNLSKEEQAKAINGANFNIELANIEFLPVIPNPDKIFCVGLNYEEHRLETGRPDAKYPAIFTRFADSQLGHEQELHLSKLSDVLDYEGELAVIIGKSGRYISEENALSYVAGYSCYNDGTFRDWQNHTHQFTPGKNFPGTGGFGPYLVTPDEIKDLEACRLQTRLNGEIMQSATISQQIFNVARVISYLSSFTNLNVGDVIATGTPGGVGFKRNPKVLMKQGDIVEIEIDNIGLLRNKIGAPI